MRQQTIRRRRKPGEAPISVFSSTLVEKPKRGRRTIPDNFLLGARNQWASLLEDSWPEIGWPLLQIRERPTTTIDDVRNAFQPVKEKPHNSGLANSFYRETFEIAKPTEVLRNRKSVGELQAAIHHGQAKLTEIQRSILDAGEALKIAAPEERKTVEEEITRRQSASLQVETDLDRLIIERNALDTKTLDQEAYVYGHELHDFLQSGRYAVNPQSVANALAGLPTMRWRQSHLRCSRMPLEDPGLTYQILGVMLKLWKRRPGESIESLIGSFRDQLPKLPKKLGYAREFLLGNWRDLRIAIEECQNSKHEDSETPYFLTSIFMRNIRNQKSPLERMLAEQEKLNI